MHSAVPKMKHTDSPTDTTSPLCIYFLQVKHMKREYAM